MLIGLTVIYMISIGLAVFMVSYKLLSEKSPFVTALSSYPLTFFPHVFNGAIIMAGFSTMSASLFAVVNLLVTMAKDGDAPSIFTKKLEKFRKLPLLPWCSPRSVYRLQSSRHSYCPEKYTNTLQRLPAYCRCIIGRSLSFRLTKF